mmetsp:Transcript_14742/g.20541  ORF Transcript_14742/g.20541 Transcript_14742/m.20541 type:complete len:113 (-) Transcript_14742:97-435(-)
MSLQQTKSILESELQSRPPKQELLDRNILKSDVAPAIQPSQCAIENKIAHRPDPQELREKHILVGQPNVAPHLVEAQNQLRKAKMEEELNKKIDQRPTKEELVQKHILVGTK